MKIKTETLVYINIFVTGMLFGAILINIFNILIR